MKGILIALSCAIATVSFAVTRPVQDDATPPVDRFIDVFSRRLEAHGRDVTADEKQALREVFPLLIRASEDKYLRSRFWRIVKQSEPKRIEWEEARRLILKGKICTSLQTHSKLVGIIAFSGEEYTTEEPEIDAVLRVIRTVDPKGVFIRCMTE